MNPGWISAGVVALVQLCGMVWWAATTHADRRYARERDEKHEEEMVLHRKSLEAMRELLHQFNNRLTLVEDRMPARAHARR